MATKKVFDGKMAWKLIYQTATLATLIIGCVYIYLSTKDENLSFGIYCVAMAVLLNKGN